MIGMPIFVILVISCMLSIIFFMHSNKPDEYRNIELKIVSINSESSLSNDKFHTPQLCNTILFVTLSEPKLYIEINTCNLPLYVHIDTKWLYNHRPGDTIHFDYLHKDRFFTIDPR